MKIKNLAFELHHLESHILNLQDPTLRETLVTLTDSMMDELKRACVARNEQRNFKLVA
jgi:hypothetical protein